ncbi:helix-turn-helix domain-containing protein [Xylocopilactobacillus apicola]|uniref:HTH cro/C1-type domain-containing protein n=1 Tax=Xylocopilactobacillus apicola TaxID=2932184 RepID=A0AAU9DME0_9LACO|nr:helix-turn-helix transcriptional regulator [Xylocopilactobacillus apicola]BDR58107.1 hypothetical protein XA3_05480 [Xylocopilactobacillus apicola]
MKFSKRLQMQRTKLNLTQAEVAKKLHVTQQTVSGWENGRSYPDIDCLLELSDLYQVSLDTLLKEDIGMKEDIKKKEVINGIKPVITILVVVNAILAVVTMIFEINNQNPGMADVLLDSVVAINELVSFYLINFMNHKLRDQVPKKFDHLIWPVLLGAWILTAGLFFSPLPHVVTVVLGLALLVVTLFFCFK